MKTKTSTPPAGSGDALAHSQSNDDPCQGSTRAVAPPEVVVGRPRGRGDRRVARFGGPCMRGPRGGVGRELASRESRGGVGPSPVRRSADTTRARDPCSAGSATTANRARPGIIAPACPGRRGSAPGGRVGRARAGPGLRPGPAGGPRRHLPGARRAGQCRRADPPRGVRAQQRAAGRGRPRAGQDLPGDLPPAQRGRGRRALSPARPHRSPAVHVEQRDQFAIRGDPRDS